MVAAMMDAVRFTGARQAQARYSRGPPFCPERRRASQTVLRHYDGSGNFVQAPGGAARQSTPSDVLRSLMAA